MAIEATVRRTVRLWTQEQSIWTGWMRQIYVNGKALDTIIQTSNQSTIWSDIKMQGDNKEIY